jgi:hypothetical protein
MTIRRNFTAALLGSILAGILAVAPARAQAIGGNASIDATTTSARVALPVAPLGNFKSVLIKPAAGATAEVFYKFGDVTVVAVSPSSPALPANGICIVPPTATTYIAAVTGTGTASVRITQMNTCPPF